MADKENEQFDEAVEERVSTKNIKYGKRILRFFMILL